jgi:arginine decarboxylase
MSRKKADTGRRKAESRGVRESGPEAEGSDGLARKSLVPTKMFLTSGVGVHERQINASDLAFRAAGIGECNRVQVSSMIPPGCELISRAEGEKLLAGGQILFAVLAPAETIEPSQQIASAVALAIPDQGRTGCIAEVFAQESLGKTADQATRQAQEMALEMLASRLGVEFDVKKEYRKGKKTYRMGETTVRAHQMSVEAQGDQHNRYTIILTALAFIL